MPPAVQFCEMYVITAEHPPRMKNGNFSKTVFLLNRLSGQKSNKSITAGSIVLVGLDIRANMYAKRQKAYMIAD